jgi:hypothetical protein
MNAHSVPKVCAGKEQANYRAAVSAMLQDIKRDTGLPWEAIADRLDMSVGTIYAARDKQSDLSGLYLMRVGARFGGSYLNPVLKIAEVQAAPLEGSIEADILPLLTALTHKVACARDPDGPGGTHEVPQERAAYLPDLKRVNKATGRLAKVIEEQLA